MFPAVTFKNNKLEIIDQTLIPASMQYIELKQLDDVINAIKTLKVRGAPALGIVAAYTMYVIANKHKNEPREQFLKSMDTTSRALFDSRPTAVNIGWALQRLKMVYSSNSLHTVAESIDAIKAEAIKIHEEDKQACESIGRNGLKIVSDPCNILTHCNTGSLATGGLGTAMAVIYAAHNSGYKIHVYVDETRPLGQGARLTFWELMQNKIPCTMHTDSSAASLMKMGKIDLVLFGADRIAANGDVANKIGSYNLAALAFLHKIPCYAVAPLSTFDAAIKSGEDIPIEQRDQKEILQIYGYNYNFSNNARVYNPAFDVTPAKYLKGIITETGIIEQPDTFKITKILNNTK